MSAGRRVRRGKIRFLERRARHMLPTGLVRVQAPELPRRARARCARAGWRAFVCPHGPFAFPFSSLAAPQLDLNLPRRALQNDLDGFFVVRRLLFLRRRRARPPCSYCSSSRSCSCSWSSAVLPGPDCPSGATQSAALVSPSPRDSPRTTRFSAGLSVSTPPHAITKIERSRGSISCQPPPIGLSLFDLVVLDLVEQGRDGLISNNSAGPRGGCPFVFLQRAANQDLLDRPIRSSSTDSSPVRSCTWNGIERLAHAARANRPPPDRVRFRRAPSRARIRVLELAHVSPASRTRGGSSSRPPRRPRMFVPEPRVVPRDEVDR